MNELLEVLTHQEYLDINKRLKLGYVPSHFQLHVRIGSKKTKVIDLTLKQLESIINTNQYSQAVSKVYEKILSEEDSFLEFGDQLVEQLDQYDLKNKSLIERVISYISLARYIYLENGVKVFLDQRENTIELIIQDKERSFNYPGTSLDKIFKCLDSYVMFSKKRISDSEKILTSSIKKNMDINNYPTILEETDNIDEILSELNKEQKRI